MDFFFDEMDLLHFVVRETDDLYTHIKSYNRY